MSRHSMSKNKDPFVLKIQKDLKIFNNLTFILDKLQKEGLFGNIKDIINRIFEKELKFTLESKC